MKYPRILARITSTPWAILPSAFDAITRALNGEIPRIDEDGSDETAGIEQREDVGPIALIPFAGVVGKHLSGMELMCGGCCLQRVQEEFDAAIANERIKDIVLVVNSPGGTVTGVPEFARHIREASAVSGKRIHAFTDSMMASAAYWIAGACDFIAATPTAHIGSIGVYTAFEDRSEANAKAGVKLNLIKAGKYKDMYSDHRAPTPEEQAMIQGRVDAIWEMFKADVTRERQIDAGALEGQTFMGAAAQSVGLVDKIVPGLEEFLAELGFAHVG